MGLAGVGNYCIYQFIISFKIHAYLVRITGKVQRIISVFIQHVLT